MGWLDVSPEFKSEISAEDINLGVANVLGTKQGEITKGTRMRARVRRIGNQQAELLPQTPNGESI